jgi:hypothetical protein
MIPDRVRSALGLWVPLAIGLWIIATAIAFYFTADLGPTGLFHQDLESWRLVCSAGVVLVGGLMILSTYGRYRRAKAASSEPKP